MKNAIKVLVAVAAISAVLAIVLRVSLTSFAGMNSTAFVRLAGLLLLFAIALAGLKK
jgi:hypothetical protein